MNIDFNAAESFISTLCELNEHSYVSLKNERFVQTNEKNKALRNTEISKIAEACLELMQNGNEKEGEEYFNLINKLKVGLTKYKEREMKKIVHNRNLSDHMKITLLTITSIDPEEENKVFECYFNYNQKLISELIQEKTVIEKTIEKAHFSKNSLSKKIFDCESKFSYLEQRLASKKEEHIESQSEDKKELRKKIKGLINEKNLLTAEIVKLEEELKKINTRKLEQDDNIALLKVFKEERIIEMTPIKKFIYKIPNLEELIKKSKEIDTYNNHLKTTKELAIDITKINELKNEITNKNRDIIKTTLEIEDLSKKIEFKKNEIENKNNSTNKTILKWHNKDLESFIINLKASNDILEKHNAILKLFITSLKSYTYIADSRKKTIDDIEKTNPDFKKNSKGILKSKLFTFIDSINLPDDAISLFFMKTLGSTSKEIDLLKKAGAAASNAFKSIIRDLESDVSKKNSSSSAVLMAIEELKFALHLKKLIKPPQIENSIIQQILEKINHLREQTKNKGIKPSVILPGGSKEHGILYKIDAEDDGFFSFSIINTGQGIVKVGSKAVDIKYTELSLKELTSNFFKFIFESQFNPKMNMKTILKGIEDLLSNPARSNKKNGHAHSPQKGANCTVQCILAYLQEKLGKEFMQVKAHISLESIESAKEWIKPNNAIRAALRVFLSVRDKDVDAIFKRIIANAEYVKEKRLTKAEKAKESAHDQSYDKKDAYKK